MPFPGLEVPLPGLVAPLPVPKVPLPSPPFPPELPLPPLPEDPFPVVKVWVLVVMVWVAVSENLDGVEAIGKESFTYGIGKPWKALEISSHHEEKNRQIERVF